MKSVVSGIFILTIVLVSSIYAESTEMKKFKSDYSLLDLELLNNPCQVAEVKDFVYQKDLAKFTFASGSFYFLRYVDNRPTTAIFIGQGQAKIEIPSHSERNSLVCVSKKESVYEPFEVCFIRFGDNLDEKVRERFPFTETTLSWKIFNSAKQSQGEVFFKPVIYHKFDNFFQLLRSSYQRADDGFFWVDFNRYVFAFDPNRAEQCRLSYEFEGGDFAITDAVILQRQEYGVYDDSALSNISYPTTCFERDANFTMGGQDGLRIEDAMGTIRLIVNWDSLKYVSLFLDQHLKEDSIYFEEKPVDYWRRKTFDFIGVILPKYYYKGDTLEFVLWYKGKDYISTLPYVENPQASMVNFELKVPGGSNYFMPGKLPGENSKVVVAAPFRPYDDFRFQAYVTGADTVTVTSDVGIALNYITLSHITKHNFTCFVPENIQQTAATSAFNFMSQRFGTPPSAFEIFVSPEVGRGMPGLAYVPQVACVAEFDAFGGIDLMAGNGIGNQWFGGGLLPASDRESWMAASLAKYLSLMYVENTRGGRAYFSNLFNRSDTLHQVIGRGWDLPLACGGRLKEAIASNKGIWLMHMIRFLMFDPNTRTSPNFNKFVQELAVMGNNGKFSNADFIRLAEKHAEKSLTNFFAQWIYGYGMPEFDVEYSYVQRDGKYYIDGNVVTKKVDASFEMPVIMRVEVKGSSAEESQYFSETVKAPESKFSLGPFDSEPKKFAFNEFFSVLSQDKVKKK